MFRIILNSLRVLFNGIPVTDINNFIGRTAVIQKAEYIYIYNTIKQTERIHEMRSHISFSAFIIIELLEDK